MNQVELRKLAREILASNFARGFVSNQALLDAALAVLNTPDRIGE